MPDLDKSIWEDMQKKPSGKLGRIQGHHFRFTVVFIILPGKTDRMAVKGQNSRIANRDPVGITAKIANDVPWRLEGLLRKDNPGGAIQWIDQGKEVTWEGKLGSLIKEDQFPLVVGLFEKVKKLTSELVRNDFYRDEEFLAGIDKAKAVVSKAAARNNTVNVRMKG
ncbi:Hypothetical protein DEACI_3954 [Acididesulfobacillus acetoxydans]|uniref:Uncharacterized protein n=1 Tax=Acididesulfobacillus acetoxydans TaxID=1561005 RepID=A0A8S0X1G8_9FIRM|nr:Hypothetical protein DEACI_3954 [Acididesulfobacillus acetoxydans]CEJ05631.1 Hypothetical protein DEACI_0005 [Acididesulfobacillus acetoxydans]